MIFRRHYPIILCLTVFIALQVFFKFNQRLSDIQVIVPDFPLDVQLPIVKNENQDENLINNGEPIDKILKNDDQNREPKGQSTVLYSIVFYLDSLHGEPPDKSKANDLNPLKNVEAKNEKLEQSKENKNDEQIEMLEQVKNDKSNDKDKSKGKRCILVKFYLLR